MAKKDPFAPQASRPGGKSKVRFTYGEVRAGTKKTPKEIRRAALAKNKLNDAVHRYLDMIDEASSSSAEFHAALQELRDLSSYEAPVLPAQDPYAAKDA